MKSGAFMTVDKLAAVTRAVGALAARSVLVGIPEAKDARKEDGPMNNATIGYIMEKGSPAANIPARPWLVPGVQRAAPEYIPELMEASAAALAGDQAGVSSHLARAGIMAQNEVRLHISEGIPPPLADSTVKARARRGRKGARDELVNRAVPGIGASMELVKPLVDTGQLRNAVSYVVQ